MVLMSALIMLIVFGGLGSEASLMVFASPGVIIIPLYEVLELLCGFAVFTFSKRLGF